MSAQLRTRAVGVVVILGVAVGLSGCDPNPIGDGPIVVRQAIDVVEVALCGEADVRSALVYFDLPGAPGFEAFNGDAPQYVRAGGSLELEPVLPPPAPLEDGSEIHVVVNTSTGTLRGDFLIGDKGLDGRWLATDGTVSEVACGDD